MGKPSNSSGKRSANQLRIATQEIAEQTRPARKEYFRDLQAALEGRAQDIPSAQTAYRDVLSSGTASLRDLASDYKKLGIEDRFAKPGVDRARMEVGRSAEDARQAIVNAFLGQAPSSILGTTAQGQQGLLSSAQRGFGIAAAQQQQQTQLAASGAAAAASILAALLI